MTTEKKAVETNDELAGGKEVESNWMKFLKVGDKIKGTLVSKSLQKSTNPTYKDQYVCEIQTADGQIWNVGISITKKGTVSRIMKCQIGEIIAIVFDSEGDSAVKGGAPAKNLKVLSFGMDPNYSAGEEVQIDEIAF